MRVHTESCMRSHAALPPADMLNTRIPAETYRTEAQRARELGARVPDIAERRMLLRIAEEYDELAHKAQGQSKLVW